MKPKLDRYEKLRQELLASGDLVQDGDGGRLVKTVSFSTPSGAATSCWVGPTTDGLSGKMATSRRWMRCIGSRKVVDEAGFYRLRS